MTEAKTETRLPDRRIDPETFEDTEALDIVAAELALYLRRGEFGAVKGFFVVQEVADIAGLLDHMETADALVAMRQLPAADQAETFGYLSPSTQVALSEAMDQIGRAHV